MLDPKQQSEVDQSAAYLGEAFPPLWRRLYENCIERGFSESESLKLVQTYILSQCRYGIRGDDG